MSTYSPAPQTPFARSALGGFCAKIFARTDKFSPFLRQAIEPGYFWSDTSRAIFINWSDGSLNRSLSFGFIPLPCLHLMIHNLGDIPGMRP